MYLKRPPKWLWENYCYLWHKKGKGVFEFKEALAILKISENMLLKTLSELEKKGLLIKWRSEYERRIKKYQLIAKDAIELIENYTLKERREKNQLTLTEKLRLITQMKYLITGSTAAYYYHKYIIPPPVFELKILNKDLDEWLFFLTDRNTKVYGWAEKQDLEIPSTEKHKFIIRFSKWLSDQEYERKEENQGLFYQSKEDLIFDLIKKRTQLSVTEAIAIIITNKIDWKCLESVFRERGKLHRELGALLDIIYNSNKKLVPEHFVEKLKKQIKGESPKLFPADIVSEERYEEQLKCREKSDYHRLSKKWKLPLVLPKEAVRKVFEDLR